jgi:PE-PPE domain/PE family
MSYLVAAPEVMSAVATDIDGIGSALDAAHTAVAGPTSGLVAAAGDEVSTAIARLFGEYGRAYQAVVPPAARFHSEFTQTLAAAESAYAQAEAAASNGLGALQADARALLGGAGAVGSATPAAMPMTATNVNALIMGGSGNPIPSMGFVNGLLNWVSTSQFNVLNKLPLVTPEELYPLTGIKSLPLTTSLSQGVTILDNALFGPQGQITLGNNALVVGYSQSSMIASLEMRNILNLPVGSQPSSTQLGFTLMADPMNPNGGLFARFPGLNLPSMGLDFYGATPSNTPWPTNIYTIEYDGFADFPRYPINILSDLNAFAGIVFVHPTYPTVNPQTLPPGQIVHLETEPTYTGNTNYYMVQNANLPLLDPLKAIPVVGKPLVDLLQPDLTVLVNLGYGDPNFGYSTSYANVPTSFGLFPHVNPGVIAADLVAGAGQGIHDAASDIVAQGPPSGPPSSLPVPHPLPPIPSLGTLLSPASIDAFINGLQTANTNLANAITSASASAYATLLPTADTLAGGFEGLVLLGATAAVIKDFTGLIP